MVSSGSMLANSYCSQRRHECACAQCHYQIITRLVVLFNLKRLWIRSVAFRTTFTTTTCSIVFGLPWARHSMHDQKFWCSCHGYDSWLQLWCRSTSCTALQEKLALPLVLTEMDTWSNTFWQKGGENGCNRLSVVTLTFRFFFHSVAAYVSEVVPVDNRHLIGSFRNNYIGIIKLEWTERFAKI